MVAFKSKFPINVHACKKIFGTFYSKICSFSLYHTFKSEKVCGTAFSVEKKIAEKVRKSGRHFWAIWGNFGPFGVIFGPFLGHFGSFLGHFVAFLDKFAES